MSGSDDNVKEVPADSESEGIGSGTIGVAILCFVIGFVASSITGWVVFPKLLYSKQNQPINFNHELHMGEVEDGCESCHFYRDDGSFAGVPKLAQCTDCHEAEPMSEDPDEVKFAEEYVANEKEVPWLIYARQPDCVFFSHAAHKDTDCVTCHGPIGESTQLKVYEENRLTGYSRDIWGQNIGGFKKNSWDRMKMDDCAECHEKETGSKGPCFQCHK